jgi:hypothetical protein
MNTVSPTSVFIRPFGLNSSGKPQTTPVSSEDHYLTASTETDSFMKSMPSISNSITLQRSGNIPQVKKMQLATPFKSKETMQAMGVLIAHLHINEGKYFAITNTEEPLVESIARLFSVDKSHIKPRTDFPDPKKKPTYTIIINPQAKVLDYNERQPKNRDKRTLDAYEYIQECKDLLEEPPPIHLPPKVTQELMDQRQWVMEGFLTSVLKGEFEKRTEKIRNADSSITEIPKTDQLKRLKITKVPKELLPIIADFLKTADPYQTIANLKITHNEEAGNIIINGGAYPMIDLVRLLKGNLKVDPFQPFSELFRRSEAYANSLGARPEIQ